MGCARGGGLQASSSAGGLSDRLVGDMTYGLELGGCALRPPPGRKNPSQTAGTRPGLPAMVEGPPRGPPRKTLVFDAGGGRYGGGGAARCGVSGECYG